MVIDHSIGIGEANLADDEPRAVQATKEELLKEYEDWGSDAAVIMNSIETTNKWSIEVLYPPLETYVKGSVALLGDAVSIFKHRIHKVGTLNSDRHMQWRHISELELVRVSKTRTYWLSCSVTLV